MKELEPVRLPLQHVTVTMKVTRSRRGELLALENGKMSFVDTDLKKTVVKLTHNLTKKSPNKDASFVTLIYGEDVAEDQAEEIREAVAERLGDSAEGCSDCRQTAGLLLYHFG